jgi:hypothetical protein
MAVNADPGTAQSGDVFLSHVSARAIEAVCLLTVVALDLEMLMTGYPMLSFHRHAQPFSSRCERE